MQKVKNKRVLKETHVHEGVNKTKLIFEMTDTEELLVEKDKEIDR